MHLTISRYWLPRSHKLSQVIGDRWMGSFLVFSVVDAIDFVWGFFVCFASFFERVDNIYTYFCLMQGISIVEDRFNF